MGYQNQRRFFYNNLDPQELNAFMHEHGVSVLRMALITGSREDRVVEWKDGNHDIPPIVGVLIDLMKACPAGVAVAEESATSLLNHTKGFQNNLEPN